MTKIKNILFVCTGNSCRSVMAKGLFKKIISERKDLASENIKAVSAGTINFPGRGTTPETIAVMAKEGIDISTHVSQGLSEKMIKEADLILVMENGHRDKIIRMYPKAANKTHLLSEYCRIPEENSLVNSDIPDPIGQSIEVYERSYLVIKEAVERVINKLWPIQGAE